MKRPPLAELEVHCQKPDHRRVGNWMARHVSRPLALRITWILTPWNVSPHLVTCLAWLCGLAGAAAFACGNVSGWLAGALLLQIWYLLDHVDGQLARYYGTASLDGVELDYLMHHTLNLLVPCGVGFGFFASAQSPGWSALGLVWGLGLLLLGLVHDARYKAFVQRLKRTRGQLHVTGGGGARPAPTPPVPRDPVRFALWAVRKSCEMHVVMNLLTAIAVGQWLLAGPDLIAGRLYLLIAAPLALGTAAGTVTRSIRRQTAEQEFAAWFKAPDGYELRYEAGWWLIARHGADCLHQPAPEAGPRPFVLTPGGSSPYFAASNEAPKR